MYNVILFWLVIFAVIYIFTRKEDEQDKCDIDKEEEAKEEMKLTLPGRREELSRLLNDDIDEDQKRLELKRFNNRCFNCETEEGLEMDHHLPLSRGYPLRCKEIGSNTVVLCRACNRRKGDKLPEEFYTAEKLKQLEEMGIKSHLDYSPLRMEELENLLIGEKIKKISKAIEENQRLVFTYYDMTNILFTGEELSITPVKIEEGKNIRSCGIKREWYLKDSCSRIYNIRWIFNIRKEL